jgi:RHS repeat-associated protein
LIASGNNGTTLDKITTPTATNSWNLDALGNPTVIGSVAQNFNPQDQITSITGKTTPTYDNNGNMTKDEAGHTYIYDAWNRMVSAYNGSGNAEIISYDADNRRPGLSICSTTVTDSYYTTSWQDIEDDVVTFGCGGGTTKSTYVWSQSYIDDMVARDSSFNNGAVTRVYAEQDANHDTTSLVSAGGGPLERFVYDPYGTRTVLNGTTWAVTSDSQSWLFGFQGGRLDLTSGKINFRHRDLDTVTDTWMEKDPIGYAAGANPYQDDDSDPTGVVDPTGRMPGDLPLSAPSIMYGLDTFRDEMREFVALINSGYAPGPARFVVTAHHLPIASSACAISDLQHGRTFTGHVLSKSEQADHVIGIAWDVTTSVIMLDSFGAPNANVPQPTGIPGVNLRPSLMAPLGRSTTEITVDAARFPEAVQHMQDANVLNRALTLDRAGAAARRANNLRGLAKVAGKDLDECPPAMFKESSDASVRAINRSQNRGSGASMGNQLRPVPDGSTVVIRSNDAK